MNMYLGTKRELYSLKDLAIILILAVVYVITAKFGLLFTFVNASVTAIWPATGVAIAVLVVFGLRFWPGIFIGAYFANLATAGTILTSLGIATGNTLEALLAAYLVERYSVGDGLFNYPKNIIRYFFLAGFLSTAVSATIGATSLLLGSLTNLWNYPATWLTWWLGDMAGAIIVAPFLIVFFRRKEILLEKREPAKAFLALMSLILISFVIFGGYFDTIIKNYPLEYLVIPIMIWIAVKFDQEESTLGVLILAAIANFGTLKGYGPFAETMDNTSLLLLQMFLGVISFATLSLSASVKEKSRAEEELRIRNEEIKRRLTQDETLLNSMGEGMIATDKDGVIITINQAALKFLGWSKEDLSGKKLDEIMTVEDEKGELIPMRERPAGLVLRGQAKTISNKDLYYVRPDGTRFPVAIIVSPLVLNHDIYGVIEVFHDITIEKETEKAQREFISIASHQLRTPIANTLWQAEMLLDKTTGTLNDKQKEYLENIYRASERLNALTNDLLSASRIETKKLYSQIEDVDVVEIAEMVVKDHESTIKEKHLVLRKKYNENLGVVRTDAKIVRLTIQNLLSNAIKYTPQHGSIDLDIRMEKDELRITIADTGYGIPKDQQPKIFAKFFRGSNIKDKDPDGTGLGLYIIKSMMDKVGGKIHFESTEGKGTTFYIIIPTSNKTEGIVAHGRNIV